MKRKLSLGGRCISVAFAIVVIACCNRGFSQTEKIGGVEWDVSVKKAVQFCDSLNGINTDTTYALADTASINQKLLGVKPENLTLEWTLPSADGSIWLVAYENGSILSEKVEVTEANNIPSYQGNIQVAFKFSDAKKWEEITKENIGKRLAIFVNGQLMNAPQVNCEITSGNCSVSIPANIIHEYLPSLNLEKLKIK